MKSACEEDLDWRRDRGSVVTDEEKASEETEAGLQSSLVLGK